ncbi:MAG TPA: alpha/beta hydrolase, partial [Vicinamibacterales bacterium]|nr:alpha/beta hydrolase [Vicinamibacterales bacterium]
VRSLVLDGAVSLGAEFPRSVGRDAQRALDLLLGRCAADEECAAAFPDAKAMVGRLLARFDRGPIAAMLPHPRTAAGVQLTLTRDTVAEIIRVALYTPQDAARLLQVIRHAAQDDFGPLAAQYVHSASMSVDEMALGATMSILCSEDMPPLAAADFDGAGRGTFLGAAYAEAWRSRCREWPAGPPIAIDPGATSAAPTLILSGASDPVTPPSSGEAMGRHFPNHLHLVVPGAAHNASFTGCVPDLIAAFVAQGSAEPLEAGCIAATPLPPIAANDAGGRT